MKKAIEADNTVSNWHLKIKTGRDAICYIQVSGCQVHVCSNFESEHTCDETPNQIGK